MMSELPIDVCEMIETKVNKLKYDDVMKEMKNVNIEILRSLDYEMILYNDDARRESVQSRENNMICALEYEFETYAPEIHLCMDIMLIKRINENREMINEEIGIDADDIITDIMKDALQRNGLIYNESEDNMMKLMKI